MLAVLLVLAADLQTDPSFQAGKRLYEELAFEEAMMKIHNAGTVAATTPEERAEVLVWVAMCHAGLNQRVEARATLADALRLHAEVQPPDIAPPLVFDLLAELRAAEPTRPPPKKTPDPPPPPAPPPPAPPEDPLPSPWMAGAVVAATAGVVAAGGGGLLAVLAVRNAAIADDKDALQKDVADGIATANVQMGVAVGLLALAAVFGGGAAALVLLAPDDAR